MPTSRRPTWQHEPTSTASQPDTVPSKSLPPLSSLDRMATGEHLGQCPACGGHRWWDNRSRKATGEMTRAEPDYVCTECRYGRWNDGRHQAGRATTRRTPPVTTVVLPAVGPVFATRPTWDGVCSAQARRDALPQRRNGRVTVLRSARGRCRRCTDSAGQAVSWHDQGRQAVPCGPRTWVRLLPATRPSSIARRHGMAALGRPSTDRALSSLRRVC